jgi:hypothetical protein
MGKTFLLALMTSPYALLAGEGGLFLGSYSPQSLFIQSAVANIHYESVIG